MKIGLDFDGVICNDEQLKIYGAKKLYGVTLPEGRAKKEFIQKDNIITLEQYRHLQQYIFETDSMIEVMEPVGSVFSFLEKLAADKHDIKILTARSPKGVRVAKAWMSAHGIKNIPFVSTGYEKSKAPHARGLFVYIDDRPQVLADLVGVVPHRFLFSWRYNNHIDVESTATRISSWEEFYLALDKLKNTRKLPWRLFDLLRAFRSS